MCFCLLRNKATKNPQGDYEYGFHWVSLKDTVRTAGLHPFFNLFHVHGHRAFVPKIFIDFLPHRIGIIAMHSNTTGSPRRSTIWVNP
jgi:hypothetical protein